MSASTTTDQYDNVIRACRDLYVKKTRDYGTAWRVLRPSSLTDQIYIKASRIRSLEMMAGQRQVDEGVESEYIGIINYCIMALIQLDMQEETDTDLPLEQATQLYDEHASTTRALMLRKNHDYGEAWRSMRVSSITDLILMKIVRTKSIEDNDGTTLVSEGLDANYMDMINYAVFALILLSEQN